MRQIQVAGSTAIWRIILLHTTMLSLHISVVNFNVQQSINKYQAVIALLSPAAADEWKRSSVFSVASTAMVF